MIMKHSRKQLFIHAGLAGIMVMILSNTYRINSAGAPIGSTGAPGEATCAKVGCHEGSDINSGTGELNVSIEGNPVEYEPGKTYTLEVTLAQDVIDRFGFQLLALKDDQQSAGTLIVEETERTQVLDGVNQFAGRSYITYKVKGTDPYSPHLGKWRFQWKAPETNEGLVTFYLAGVAANNDGTDHGDQVYTKTALLKPILTGYAPLKQNMQRLAIYPNPSKGASQLIYELKNPEHTEVSLFDLKGNLVKTVWSGMQDTGRHSLDIATDLSKGVYIVRMECGSDYSYQKLCVEP